MIRDDTRAVSVAVTHTIMLGITAILISGLILSAGTLLQNQEDRVAQQQVDEIGADVLSHVDTFERLDASGETVETTVRLDYPARIAEGPYSVAFVEDGGPYEMDWTLQIEASALGRTVHYPIPEDVQVVESSARGDTPRLSLCSDGSIGFGACPL